MQPTTPTDIARQQWNLTADNMQDIDLFGPLSKLLEDFGKQKLDKAFLQPSTWVQSHDKMNEALESSKVNFMKAFHDINTFFEENGNWRDNNECKDKNGRSMIMKSDLFQNMSEKDIRYTLKYKDDDSNTNCVEFGVYVYTRKYFTPTILFGYGKKHEEGVFYGACLDSKNLYIGEMCQNQPLGNGIMMNMYDSDQGGGSGSSEEQDEKKNATTKNPKKKKNKIIGNIRKFMCSEKMCVKMEKKIKYGCLFSRGHVFVGYVDVIGKDKNNQTFPIGEGFCYFADEQCSIRGIFDGWKVRNGVWEAGDGTKCRIPAKSKELVWNLEIPDCVNFKKMQLLLDKSKKADDMLEELMRECCGESKTVLTTSQKQRERKKKRMARKEQELEEKERIMYSDQVSRECVICLEEKETGKKCPYGHVVCHACFLTFSIQNGFDGTCSIFNKCTGVLEDM